MTPKLLIINGASGSGKTTVAKLLKEQIRQSDWIHPDGLWDTPNMDAEGVFVKVLELVQEFKAEILITDCQIKTSDISKLMDKAGMESWVNVLLKCERNIRESRLLARGWNDSFFDVIDNWSNLLEEDSKKADELVLDSGILSPEEICSRIMHLI